LLLAIVLAGKRTSYSDEKTGNVELFLHRRFYSSRKIVLVKFYGGWQHESQCAVASARRAVIFEERIRKRENYSQISWKGARQ
jgi:hypothetical protein